MLHAILLNKAGRNLSSGEVYWRQLFAASEDSLTSTIFGNLLYLPIELFWKILNNSCFIEGLTSQDPKILSVKFWPHWAPRGSSNKNFIEPDVFIRTTEFDLIIEAKRFDFNQQSRDQWEKQFQGYLNEFGEENKSVIYLAVGGISNENIENIKIENNEIKIIKCRWYRILNEVKDAQKRLKQNHGYLNNIDSTITILNDIIMGFGIHGYAIGEWLEDEDFSKLRHIDSYSLISSVLLKQEISKNLNS